MSTSAHHRPDGPGAGGTAHTLTGPPPPASSQAVRSPPGGTGGTRWGPGDGLRVLARLPGVARPQPVEVERALRQARRALARRLGTGVAPVHELEQVVLQLVVGPRVPDRRHRELRVLDAIRLLAGLAQRAAVEPDDRGVPEVRVHAVEPGGVGHRHVAVVGPRHRLGHQHLLVLGRVHVALAAHDEFGALHGAVPPDLRVVAVVADDQRDLHALGPVRDVGVLARVPGLDRTPREDLAVLLHDLALVVDEHQRVVRRLVRMLLVPLAHQREHAPHPCLAARGGEDVRLRTRYGRRGGQHLGPVVHDPLGGVLGDDHQVQAAQPALHAHHHVGDRAGVVPHLLPGVQAGHLVVDDRDADRVRARRDVTVSHRSLLLRLTSGAVPAAGRPGAVAVRGSRAPDGRRGRRAARAE